MSSSLTTIAPPRRPLRSLGEAGPPARALALELSAAGRGRIERCSRMVNQALEHLLPSPSAAPQVVHEAMRYCVLSGGKRVRPLLTLGACEAVGASPRQAVPVACAMELIHTYSLVHDDLPAMDNADQRRGQPTCHRKFGEGNAILVGDALLTLAFELLARNGTPQALAIIRTVSQACGTTGLIGGQILDLQAISQSRASTERTLNDIAERKTAALMAASVLAGALAGGASGPASPRLRSGRRFEARSAKEGGAGLPLLRRYGQRVGLAFQLIDDLHDQDGFALAVGADAARREAERLLSGALDALAPLGTRAEMLRDLARWLWSTV